MSADDYIVIRKETQYVGYRQFASSVVEGKEVFATPLFSADTLEEAIKLAQSHPTEYGFIVKGVE